MLRTLLVPLDGSPLAEHVLTTAATLAQCSGATLDLVRVHHPLAYADLAEAEPWERRARADERDYLQHVAERVAADFQIRTTATLLDEPVAAAICRRAVDVGANLIAMATHGRTGFSRLWLGSVADAVARHATVPVLLMRGDGVAAAPPAEAPTSDAWAGEPPRSMRRVLVPLDGSGLAEQVVDPAIEVARASGASLCLFRVVEPVLVRAVEYPLFYALPLPARDDDALAADVARARTYLAVVARRICEAAPLEVDMEVVAADRPAPAIIDAARAQHADVVAIATHGRGASRLVLGSVADKILRAGPATVLVLRPLQD